MIQIQLLANPTHYLVISEGNKDVGEHKIIQTLNQVTIVIEVLELSIDTSIKEKYTYIKH
jgi:hypothetical protein